MTKESTVEIIETANYSTLTHAKLDQLDELAGQVISVRGVIESIEKKTGKRNNLR